MTPNEQPNNISNDTDTNKIPTTPGTEQPSYQRRIARLIIAILFFNFIPNAIGALFPSVYEQAMIIRNGASIILAILFVITILKMLTEHRSHAKN